MGATFMKFGRAPATTNAFIGNALMVTAARLARVVSQGRNQEMDLAYREQRG
jgi:hypothetical protein